MRAPIPRTRAELLSLLASSPRLREIYASLPSGDDDSAHDPSHLLRVALWTCRLLADEALVEEAVAAALLHDLVNVPKDHVDRAMASELSAQAARPILEKAGFPPVSVETMSCAIRQHSFSRGERPGTPLAQALQDADRLEALGALGIMRAFSTGERMKSRYFHPSDPWAKGRALDDSAYTLDHFFAKLLRLPEAMNTAAGREEALLRLRPLQAFLDSLERELGEARA